MALCFFQGARVGDRQWVLFHAIAPTLAKLAMAEDIQSKEDK